MRVAAVVPAAGRGQRLGPGAPKALRLLGGQPMLVHAVRALIEARLVDLVVVAAPPAEVAAVDALLDAVPGRRVRVVAGGDTRQQSVRRALETLPETVEVILVHDAARPLAPSHLADAVAAAVLAGAAAVVPGLPVADTVKRVDAAEHVVETLPRAVLRAVQTPQGFRRELLARAHEEAYGEATDDAGLLEQLGCPVLVVPGSPDAFKVTRPDDLLHAEAVLSRRRAVHDYR
jgi:2-C-methyl-D-erythritol 4-phosphate cytidylyltransferase